MEGDYLLNKIIYAMLYFYPRPPHGGRLPDQVSNVELVGFLPTPSAWRATL